MPEWANDEELEQLINLCKIHLGIKDDDVQQGYSKDPWPTDARENEFGYPNPNLTPATTRARAQREKVAISVHSHAQTPQAALPEATGATNGTRGDGWYTLKTAFIVEGTKNRKGEKIMYKLSKVKELESKSTANLKTMEKMVAWLAKKIDELHDDGTHTEAFIKEQVETERQNSIPGIEKIYETVKEVAGQLKIQQAFWDQRPWF